MNIIYYIQSVNTVSKTVSDMSKTPYHKSEISEGSEMDTVKGMELCDCI